MDFSDAKALPGVHAVLGQAEIRKMAATDRLVVALPDRTYRQQRDRPILAGEETVYVGEPVAMVVAGDPYIVEDALALIAIDYEVLPAIGDCREALSPDAAPAHHGAPDNLLAAFTSTYGDVEAAFAGAEHVFKNPIGCTAVVHIRWSAAAASPFLIPWKSSLRCGVRPRRH